MFNPVKISNKLLGLVGFRQPFNPAFQKVDVANQASRSGYYVTDNPFVKLEQIYDSQDYAEISDANFNTFLVNKQKESIVSIASAVFNEADYIDRQILYKNTHNKKDLVSLPDGFVGYEIEVSQEKNIAFEIKRVLLDFQGTGDFKLLLFNSSKSAPIYTKDVTISSPHQEVELNWAVDNSGDYYKGTYYLGYLTAGLTIQPFERNYNDADVMSCISCLNINRVYFDHATETLFDLTIDQGFSNSIGINPDITVYEDFTDLIMNNEKLFARAVQLDLQISCLSEYLASLRSNRNERNGERIAIRVQQEIDGESNDGMLKVTGLRPQLYRSLASIRKEVQKLQRGYFGGEIMVDTLS